MGNAGNGIRFFMNRIKEFREKLGMSQTELAKIVGTSQPHIARLEASDNLTEEWMRRLARAFDVRPIDIIQMATSADFTQEFETVVPVVPGLAGALERVGVSAAKLIADSVELAGFSKGEIVLLNKSSERLANLRPGDVVACTAQAEDGSSVCFARQLLPPRLLTTNRRGANISVQADDPDLGIEIIAVVLKGDGSNE